MKISHKSARIEWRFGSRQGVLSWSKEIDIGPKSKESDEAGGVESEQRRKMERQIRP